MKSSNMLTLFSEPPQPNSMPSTFVISILLHASVFGLLAIRIIEKNRIIERFPGTPFAVRVLDFHSIPPQARLAAGSISYHGSDSSHQSASNKPASGGTSAGSPAMTRETAQLMPAPQMLIQPDLHRDLVAFKKIPVPLVVLWTPEKPVVKKIVPPTPDKASIAVVRPTLDTPINEENLADVRISSTPFVSQTPIAPPSTTSPVVVHGSEGIHKVPQTTSRPPDAQLPTPARVLSLSDVRVAQGVVVVPQVNETVAKSAPGAMLPGVLKDASATGNGTSTSKTSGNSAGNGVGAHPGNGKDLSAAPGAPAAQSGAGDRAGKENSKDGQGSNPAFNPGAGNRGTQPSASGSGGTQTAAQTGASTGSAQGTGAGSGAGAGLSTAHISLPKDGQFGVIVVGSSIAETYPETAEMWSGRMASTVYLHVGLAKNWILQYALPRLVDAASGGAGHLEAPWPYEIVRPNLDLAGTDVDALILHGFVDKDGHFEKLQLVFPDRFIQTPMVLNVLNQWQFRPAKLDGQMTPVEVLLIIPGESD